MNSRPSGLDPLFLGGGDLDGEDAAFPEATQGVTDLWLEHKAPPFLGLWGNELAASLCVGPRPPLVVGSQGSGAHPPSVGVFGITTSPWEGN